MHIANVVMERLKLSSVLRGVFTVAELQGEQAIVAVIEGTAALGLASLFQGDPQEVGVGCILVVIIVIQAQGALYRIAAYQVLAFPLFAPSLVGFRGLGAELVSCIQGGSPINVVLSHTGRKNGLGFGDVSPQVGVDEVRPHISFPGLVPFGCLQLRDISGQARGLDGDGLRIHFEWPLQ